MHSNKKQPRSSRRRKPTFDGFPPLHSPVLCSVDGCREESVLKIFSITLNNVNITDIIGPGATMWLCDAHEDMFDGPDLADELESEDGLDDERDALSHSTTMYDLEDELTEMDEEDLESWGKGSEGE